MVTFSATQTLGTWSGSSSTRCFMTKVRLGITNIPYYKALSVLIAQFYGIHRNKAMATAPKYLNEWPIDTMLVNFSDWKGAWAMIWSLPMLLVNSFHFNIWNYFQEIRIVNTERIESDGLGQFVAHVEPIIDDNKNSLGLGRVTAASKVSS